MPLVLGGEVHAAIEYILYHLRDYGEAPDHVIREHIQTAKAAYQDEVDASTWTNFGDAGGRIDYIVDEQTTLLEGLVWCWALQLLPWIKDEYNIVAVEQEFELVTGCDCGLGDLGSVYDHNDRNCNGVVLMTRPDLILERKSTGNLAYIEFKTGSYVSSDNYPDRYYDNVQFVLGARAAERVLEREVTELWVQGMHKGPRKLNSDGDQKIQYSNLCYAFVNEGSPPLVDFDVSPDYYKILPDGKKWGCTGRRGYEKMPVWEIEFPDKPAEQTPVEHYVKAWMSTEQRASNVRLIGPIDNSRFLSDKLLHQLYFEEKRWEERLYYIEQEVDKAGDDWEDDNVQAMVEELIPRSWNCKKYGEEHLCTYVPWCHEKISGSMLDDDRYERRDPNHPIEKELSEYYSKGKW